jgi:putative peptide zinc metalloprotease protein
VILWFSRGITCPFCRVHMEQVMNAYRELVTHETEVIQVSPNLLESARVFLRNSDLPYPFVCDPDKRLYALYGLGDRGVLEATRNTVVSFSHAFSNGQGAETVRASWLELTNRNFLRRLHHHAMTAVEQGIFLIDSSGFIRHRMIVGPIDAIPGPEELLALTVAHCGGPIVSR